MSKVAVHGEIRALRRSVTPVVCGFRLGLSSLLGKWRESDKSVGYIVLVLLHFVSIAVGIAVLIPVKNRLGRVIEGYFAEKKLQF